MRFQGQKLGYVAGSQSDGKSLILRLPHGDLSKAPRLGDLVLIRDESTNQRWLARVESQAHVSIELHEQEVRNAIARGQTSLGQELSDHEKEMYLGHDYALKLLGELREKLKFAPVVRVMPPRGSTVNHLKADELKQLLTLDSDGTTIGYYAVGDEVHADNSNQIPVKFSVKRFVSRRSAIFGVAGFGKSNLMKNILAELTVSESTVGKLVFDLDGEYSFGSRAKLALGGKEVGKARVGLADIPAVADRLVVYTQAQREEQTYANVIAGAPVLNLGEISPRKVIATLLPESRQETVYAGLLRALNFQHWKALLALVSDEKTGGYDTDVQAVATALGIKLDENLTSIQAIIRALVPMTKGHNPASNMLSEVMQNLKLGATVIVDLSSMGVDAAYNLTTFMVDEIFAANQDAFVAGVEVPEIVIFVEEAQNLLSDKQVREGNPIARLAKEGRKYNLGLVYISQQPGAIAKEILTQTNTYFVLHLLSKTDLKALQEINPHYDGVIGDFIQTESLQGHAYIYSTVPDVQPQSYVFGTKAASFEQTVNELKNRPRPATIEIRKQRTEAITVIAGLLKSVLATQHPLSEREERCYNNAAVSGEVAKQLPADVAFARDARSPKYLDANWLTAACEHLGYTARIDWNLRPPQLCLKEKTPLPQPVRIQKQGVIDEFSF